MKDMEIKIAYKDRALSVTRKAEETVQSSDVIILQVMGLAGTMESLMEGLSKKERERKIKEGVEIVSHLLTELLTASKRMVFTGKEAAFMAELMRQKPERQEDEA